MKISLDELAAYISHLVLRGATEVSLEYTGGFTILGWRFPEQPWGSVPLELEEELCRLSDSFC